MDRKSELKGELNSLINQIKINSKDAHFADKLISELLSVKGQLMVEPTELDCGKKIDEWEGDTFRITRTSRGVLYHEKGGFNIFVTPGYGALYDVLSDLVVNKDKYEELHGEEREDFELTLTAIGYCVSIPKFVFSDAAFTYEVAALVVKFINEQYEKLMNEPLQEETAEEDNIFMRGVSAMNKIKEEIQKEE